MIGAQDRGNINPLGFYLGNVGFVVIAPNLGKTMNKQVIGFVAALVAAPVMANAATLLTVDLNTVNQITIAATDGLSAATVAGSDVTGVYLNNFFVGGTGSDIDIDNAVGGLTSANNGADGTPALYRFANDPGLNVYSWTNDSLADFTLGSLAFIGSATWTVDAEDYGNLLSRMTSGSLFFPADSADDVAAATLIGEWENVNNLTPVPLPAAGWLVLSGLAGLGVVGRRRKSA